MRKFTVACVLLGCVACFAQAREWRDISGKNTVEADFVSLKDGVVFLKVSDGSMKQVPLAQLSPADQAYAKNPPASDSLLARQNAPQPVQVNLDGNDRFTEAIRQNPNDPGKYYARGMFYTNSGRLDDAAKDYQKILELSSDNAQAQAMAYTGLGVVQAKQEDFANAHESFSKAIDLDNTMAAAYRHRGDNLTNYFKKTPEGQAKFEAAKAAYRKKRDAINKRYLQKFPWQPPHSTTAEAVNNAALRNMRNVDYAMATKLEAEYRVGQGGYGYGGGGGGGGGVAVAGPTAAVGGAVIGPGLAVYPPQVVKGEVIELVANPSELAKGMPVKVGPGIPKAKPGQPVPPEAMQAIQAVDFYRDVNGDGQLQSDDQYLTTDTDPSDGFTAQVSTVGFSAGTHNYFAVPKGGNPDLDEAAVGALNLQENLLRAAADSEAALAKQLGSAANTTGLSANAADAYSREQSKITKVVNDVMREVKESAPEVAEMLDQARKTAAQATGDLRKAKSSPGVASKAPTANAQTNSQSVADQLGAAADALAKITGNDKDGEESPADANPAAAGPVDPYAPGAATEPPPGAPKTPGQAAVAAGTVNPPKNAPPKAGGSGGDDDNDVTIINKYGNDDDGDIRIVNDYDGDRDDLVDRAVGFYDDNDYDRALVEYDRVIGDRPYDVEALRGRAQTHLATGGYEYAVEDYNRLIELAPRNADFYYNRGCAHLAARRLAAADADFSMSIKLDELRSLGNLAYNNRGITRARQGDFDKAIEDFDTAIVVNRNDHLAYRNRALAYKKLGKARRSPGRLGPLQRTERRGGRKVTRRLSTPISLQPTPAHPEPGFFMRPPSPKRSAEN